VRGRGVPAGHACSGAGVSQARVSDGPWPMAARRRAAGRACPTPPAVAVACMRDDQCKHHAARRCHDASPRSAAAQQPAPSSSQQRAASRQPPAASPSVSPPRRPGPSNAPPPLPSRSSPLASAGGPRATGASRAAGGCRKPSGFKCMRRFAELARWPMEPRWPGLSHACRVHEPRLPSTHAPSPALWPNCLSPTAPSFVPPFTSILLECLPRPRRRSFVHVSLFSTLTSSPSTPGPHP
jgi:hypothetical protein